MAKYRLSYFDIAGRAETTRLLFTVAGQEFEDKRVSKEEWNSAEGKACGKYPLQQMPILEVDGVTLCQSTAIERFVANEFGLFGSSNIERAKIDVVHTTLKEAGESIAAYVFLSDESKKEELKTKALEQVVPPRLAYIEKILKSNDGGKGFVSGDSISLADLAIFQSSWLLKMGGGLELLDKVPALKALIDRVAAHPKVADYLAKKEAKK